MNPENFETPITPALQPSIQQVRHEDVLGRLEALTTEIVHLRSEQTAIRELLTGAVDQLGPVLEKMQKNPLLRGFLG